MKKSIIKKVVVVAVAVALVFAFATTAFAGSIGFSSYKLFGGSSQEIGTELRDRSNNVDLDGITTTAVTSTSWKIRGYAHTSTGEVCTDYGTYISGDTYMLAPYTETPTVVTVKSSIASSSYTTYITFSGTLYF